MGLGTECLGVRPQVVLIVGTLCILEPSLEDTDLAHKPEHIARGAPIEDLHEQRIGLITTLDLGVWGEEAEEALQRAALEYEQWPL